MTIKKAMKVMKAAERLKKYCSEFETCKGCMFYVEDSRHIDSCIIRREHPERYDIEKILRGLFSE